MSKAKSKEVAAVQDTMPAYLQGQQGEGRGSEGVGVDDLVIPRLELAQALSACVKRKDPGYIDGCEVGHLYNNVTSEIYGESIQVVPVFFRKEFLIWIDRKSPGKPDGPGFRGAYATKEEAENELPHVEHSEHCEIVDTAQHFVVIVKEDGSMEEAVISMAKSKMKVSKQLNTLVRLNGGDRFGRVYTVESVDDAKGDDDFMNLKVSNAGFPSEPVYRYAEKLYESIKSGARDVDRSTEGENVGGEKPADDQEI